MWWWDSEGQDVFRATWVRTNSVRFVSVSEQLVPLITSAPSTNTRVKHKTQSCSNFGQSDNKLMSVRSYRGQTAAGLHPDIQQQSSIIQDDPLTLTCGGEKNHSWILWDSPSVTVWVSSAHLMDGKILILILTPWRNNSTNRGSQVIYVHPSNESDPHVCVFVYFLFFLFVCSHFIWTLS